MNTILVDGGETATVVKEFPQADPQHYPEGLYLVAYPGERHVFFVDRIGHVLNAKSEVQPDGTYYLRRSR